MYVEQKNRDRNRQTICIKITKKEKKEHTQTHTPTSNYTERNEKQGTEERGTT